MPGPELTRFGSGLRVATDVMSGAGSVSMAAVVCIGSRDEPDETAGSSHFLEHLLFKGTLRRSAREVNRAVDAVGGDFNAYTTSESTVFHLRVPAEFAADATDLLCEVVAHPRLDPQEMEIERNVILGELDSALDSPDEVVVMSLADAAFAGHPLGRETLGIPDTIETMSVEDVADFHRRWYTAPNLVFAAAGRLDADRFAATVAERFDDRAAHERPERTAPGVMSPAFVQERRPIEQVHLAIGWRCVTATDPDRVPLAVLNHALGDGPCSRLHEEIRERRGLVYAVSSAATTHTDSGLQSIYCATAPEHVAEVRALVDGIVADLLARGIDDDELALAKGYLRGSLLLGMEDSGGRMSRLGASVATHDRIVPVAESLDLIESVTRDDVMAVVHRVFDAARVVSLVGPDGFDVEA
ncbi:MAG: pitrilysin family protein [Microthrixaceae bacterium]